MTYFEDLSSCEVFADPDTPEQILAVGWLERGHSYQQGPVQEEVVDALVQGLVNPWQPVAFAGGHKCSFCRLSGGSGGFVYKGTPFSMGVSNLFIPGEHCVYVAPSLIVHYIDAHEYTPPQPFCHALLTCPPMRSPAYFRALLASDGGRSLVRLSRR